MKTPSTTQDKPIKDLGNPNDDGCVLGQAGRNEDPNATTDRDNKRNSPGHRQGPNEARGLPVTRTKPPKKSLALKRPNRTTT
ncbi:hypothetical protein E3W21_27775 [Pseudomonas sp. F01002]|nr:hypothetical protein E3W21_27775 [Pseudomonas sp. F01002]